MVIGALRDKVVELVQDLNGNHVIQKCLNRLSAPDAQVSYATFQLKSIDTNKPVLVHL